MIDRYLIKLFTGIDNIIKKIGDILDEGYKIVGKLFQKRKRKK